MKKTFKILAWLIGVPLLLVFIAICTLGWLAGTDTGFSIATTQLKKRVPGIELDAIGGNLNTGVSGETLAFESGAMRVDIAGLDSTWRTGCLIKREFCLDSLTIEEVRFTQKPVENSPITSTGSIELPEISLPIDVTVSELRVIRFIFQPAGDGPPHTIENIHLTAAARGETLQIDQLAAVYQTYSARVKGSLELVGDYPLDLELALSATDVIETFDATLDVQLDNTVRNLDFDVLLGGAADARVNGRMQPLASELPLTATLSSDLLGWPLDTKEVASVNDLKLDINGTLEDYLLELEAAASGAQVPDTTLAIKGRINTERALLPEINLDTLGGAIKGTTSVDWTDGIAWLAAIGFVDILPGLQVEGLDGKLSGTIDAAGTVADGDWTLALNSADITGVLSDYPFDLAAKAHKTDPDVLVIDELILDNGDNQIRAGGSLALADTESSDLTLSAKLPQLQNLVPDLDGNITADLSINGQLTEPDIELDARTDGLSYQDYRVEGVRIVADIGEAARQDSTLTVSINDIFATDQHIQNLRLNATGKRDAHQLTVFADGPQATAVDIALAGSLSEQFDWSGELRSAVLDVPAHTITLASPTALEWNQQEALFGMDAHCWQTEETNLCLENKVFASPEGTASITLDAYPLSRLNPFLPAQTTLDGVFGLDSAVTWGPDVTGGFAARLRSRLDDGGFTVVDTYDDPVTFNYEEITLDATIDLEDVDAQLQIISQRLGTANVNVQLDAAAEQKSIVGDISLDGLDIAVAEAFVPDFDEFGGTINASGALSGTLSEPRFDGNLVLNDLLARGELLPLDIDAGSIDARILGQRAEIDGNITAGEGNIDVGGTASWGEGDWRADVTIDGQQLDIVSDPLLESDVNPSIAITARPGTVRVSGTVDIPSALIDVAELPEGAATLSDDIVIVEDLPPEDPDSLEPADSSSTDVRVDVDVSLGDDVELDAYGLEANLTGNIGVSMRSPNPVNLSGSISVVDGIYEQYGQDLEASGDILFVGPVEATRLELTAVREIDNENRTAGLLIEGRVEDPRVSLFTEPSDKSDDSILSYIVLGRDISETSDEETNLLATAALALGVKGGEFLGEGVADALGISDFGLETQGSGDNTELVVSGRLNDRLLVKYGRSVFDTESTLYLRYDLTKKLYVEAAEGIEQAVDLFYEFSF